MALVHFGMEQKHAKVVREKDIFSCLQGWREENLKKNDSDYLDELAVQHQKESDKRDFGKEILETMSHEETKEFLTPLFEERIEKKKSLEKHHKRIMRIATKQYAPSTFEFDFCVDAVWLLHGAKDDIENQKQLDSLERYYRWNESRKPSYITQSIPTKQDYEVMKMTAKQVRIESLCKMPLRGNTRLVGCCPFHEERTPSFTIFTNTNTFVCFGCGAKGDSITFYQKLYGCSFLDAIRQLIGTY